MSTIEPLTQGNIIQLCRTMPITCFWQEGGLCQTVDLAIELLMSY